MNYPDASFGGQGGYSGTQIYPIAGVYGGLYPGGGGGGGLIYDGAGNVAVGGASGSSALNGYAGGAPHADPAGASGQGGFGGGGFIGGNGGEITIENVNGPLIYDLTGGLGEDSFASGALSTPFGALSTINSGVQSYSGQVTVDFVPPVVTPPDPGPAGVPEPAAWAMMLVGFGAIGGSLRRRTRAPA